MSRSSMARIIFINAERPFGEHTEVVRAKVAAGEWEVVNAPRPIPGELTWLGDCRHGTFYAAGDPARFENALMGWSALDAWYVQEIDNDEIRRRLEALAAERRIPLQKILDVTPIGDLAAEYGYPWRS